MLGATRVGPAFFTSILAANLPSLESKQQTYMSLDNSESCITTSLLKAKSNHAQLTVATYDKKLHFLVRESQNFLDFWSEFWPDF